MNLSKPLFIAAAIACGGCQGQAPAVAPESQWQLAGKREYSNGTEIYCLNRKTGAVGVAFIPNDADDQKSFDSDCSM